MDTTQEWLWKYDWYSLISPMWRQITYRIVKDVGAEVFVGNEPLIIALRTQNSVALLDAVEGLSVSDVAYDLIDKV